MSSEGNNVAILFSLFAKQSIFQYVYFTFLCRWRNVWNYNVSLVRHELLFVYMKVYVQFKNTVDSYCKECVNTFLHRMFNYNNGFSKNNTNDWTFKCVQSKINFFFVYVWSRVVTTVGLGTTGSGSCTGCGRSFLLINLSQIKCSLQKWFGTEHIIYLSISHRHQQLGNRYSICIFLIFVWLHLLVWRQYKVWIFSEWFRFNEGSWFLIL